MPILLGLVLAWVAAVAVKRDVMTLHERGLTVSPFTARGWFWGTFWLLILFGPFYLFQRHLVMTAARPVQPLQVPMYMPMPQNVVAPQPATSPRFCSNCGRGGGAGDSFCGGCGQAVIV